MEFKADKKFKHFPITRLGNKQNDIKYFYKYLPFNSINTVIEPFAGSFAVIRNCYNDEKYKKIICDNDKEYLDIIKIIFQDLEKHFELAKKFNECDTHKPKDYSKKDIRQHYFIRGMKKKMPLLDYTEIKKIYDSMEIYDDYKETMEKYKDDENCFIFADPPYLDNSNCSYKGFKDLDCDNRIIDNTTLYIYLLEYMRTCKCKIMIVLNSNSIIEYLFKEFKKAEYPKIYQICKKKQNISIFCNYDL